MADESPKKSPKKGRRSSFVKGSESRESVYNAHNENELKCGLLSKKSSSPPKRWQTRFFEAAGHYLTYYKVGWAFVPTPSDNARR
jgi:hypothetical protein